MDVRYLILLLMLVSCMPTAQVSKGSLESTETTSGSGSGSTTTVPFNWNYLGVATNTISINVSNLNTAYIIGSTVENYLNSTETENFASVNYCMVSSYSIGGVQYELRSRVVPISYYDFTAKRTIRTLRVDFPDVTNSANTCYKQLRVRTTGSTDYIVDPTASSSPKYDPSTLCTQCTSMLTASRVRLFKSSGTYLDEVPTTLISMSSLYLQVDPNYATGGSSGTCSTATCQANGYSCCLDNQCVKDGGTKPNASTQYASLLLTAEQERLQNPLAYLNYPQLYYICASSVPSTTSGSTGGGSYDAGLAQLKKDYYCIANLKAQATSTPFNLEVLTKTYTAATDCLTSSSDAAQTMYYQNVLKRLYTTCGCNRTTLTDMVNNCPAYDYTVTTYDSLNVPARIDCYTPPTTTTPTPLQQSVSVPSRSAPHRFFDTNGVEKVPSAATAQEGDKFEYLDDGKILPSQQPFSMNAILGQMSVTLDQALPAKAISVDMDQVYFLMTTSGYYTPCPSCNKDSWFNAFTAFTTTSMGTGLEAIGHTTERDTFSTNTTLGNYEDTIFGRACWVPPTMLPYTHTTTSTFADVKSQRLNRLKNQAALFTNGYQRDWFGFNKGALIGSFDGVTWFAIGKGRIVKSTSKKLFLAINAPFADVASPTTHVVNVQAYNGITQAAQVDYDPQYHQTHSLQNEAGNCQMYHQCTTDTDCVTKLGWEYSCADVRDLKTNWPEFDSDGNEKLNVSNSLTLDQILAQKRYPSSSTKRCVYRGAGSLCHTNIGNVASTDLNKRKLLTCAPNFYCADAASAGTHNNKIARYASTLENIPVSRNHFFGKDANVLGRPLDYLGNNSLVSTTRQALSDSASPFESTLVSYVGLCQPGKSLPLSSNQLTMQNPFNQHMAVDGTRRTDFISQIGSCNSTLFTAYRHTSCPVLGTDGNYEVFSQATLPVGFNIRATAQNACGLESLLSTASLASTADDLSTQSPFRTIEAKTLNAQIILDPTLARDACFRRAGAVCHTDLDCSPNKLHSTQVDFFGTSYFGNIAEKSYWTEYLTCGQADPKPIPSQTDAFKNYDMGLNRCCREVGKDLTTYTADMATETIVTTLKPYDPVSAGLKMSVAPGIAPNDPKRYSRLATVENIGVTKPILTSNIDRNLSDQRFLDNTKTNVSTGDQWKTLSEANSESCCGGGWVRKFSDGSNDWTRRDRVILDVANFRCINSRSPLITFPEDVAGQYNSIADVQNLSGQDYGDYCKDGTNTNGACAQYSIIDSTSDVLPTSTVPYNQATINTIAPVYTTATNPDYYFKPRSGDSNAAVIIDYSSTATDARRNITIQIPSFVTREFDAEYSSLGNGAVHGTHPVKMVLDSGTSLSCMKYSGFTPSLPTTAPAAGGCNGGSGCCYSYDPSTRILKVGMTTDVSASATWTGKKVGIEFIAYTPGRSPVISRTKPGTSAYYLKRLGRLELSGIPQISYEVLTCNDNANRVVQGIFDIGINTRAQFETVNFSYFMSYAAKNSSGVATTETQRFTNAYGLQNEPIFSPNDFKCCSPLGKTVTDTTKCCSGYASGTTTKTCALPAGTDLMVYFNRFVSNEGVGTDKPGGGLLETDFESLTGEPVLSAAVNDKVRALGIAYCSSKKVRQGGAFGSFEVEPQGTDTNVSSRIYNIVDSSRDVGQNSNAGTTDVTGYPAFTDGFRWNHHLYCND
jgi:hypothetical protein